MRPALRTLAGLSTLSPGVRCEGGERGGGRGAPLTHASSSGPGLRGWQRGLRAWLAFPRHEAGSLLHKESGHYAAGAPTSLSPLCSPPCQSSHSSSFSAFSKRSSHPIQCCVCSGTGRAGLGWWLGSRTRNMTSLIPNTQTGARPAQEKVSGQSMLCSEHQ